MRHGEAEGRTLYRCGPNLFAINHRIGGYLAIAAGKKCLAGEDERVRLGAVYAPEETGLHAGADLTQASTSCNELLLHFGNLRGFLFAQLRELLTTLLA